jgi:restriction endonuclease S subunit
MECNDPEFTMGLGAGSGADPSVSTGFCIAGFCRLMHSDDERHAKFILIDYYYYFYYYNVNS